MSGQLRLGGIRRIKKHNILILIILALVVRLFFSIFLGDNALAKKSENVSSKQCFSSIDPLKNINPENEFGEKKAKNSCSKLDSKFGKQPKSEQEEIYDELVKDYPITEMVLEISKKDKSVAAFLIAIAKKESDWGKHSPKKNGEDCYNYWGYRGGYNTTASGYSCFDSPEQAVEVVGGRIENLIGQGIDTPERMIVWKCGRDCSWDNPVAVKKWVSDVSAYYHKLNS
ncbi:MAG: hypothetical protein Q7U36_01210 [bacterium]|nr:hypothetical protein [bacterium]